MVNLKSIFKNPFHLSILVTSLLFIGIFLVGYNSGLTKDLKDVPYDLSFKSIFLHNSILSLINIFLGMISFGIINIYTLFVNAFDLGNILNYSINSNGFWPSMRLFIPHAFLELPSIIMSLSLGFVPIFILILKSTNLIIENFSKKYFFKKIFFLSMLIIILNVLAAFMETFISVN